MINKIKQLLGIVPEADYVQLIKQGAIILDVRTNSEYSGGCIKESINIPVDQLAGSLSKLKDKNKPIITCCLSGSRSAAAKNILKSNGYTQVYNAGGWRSLQNKIKNGSS